MTCRPNWHNAWTGSLRNRDDRRNYFARTATGRTFMKKIIAVAILSTFVLCLPFASSQEQAKRSEPELKALAKIQQLGGLAMELAQNDDHLEVSYQQRDQKLTDECLAVLKDLPGLVHLNLRGQEVTDAN